MKKLIALLLAAAMLVTTAYAADVNVNRTNGVITVSGTTTAGTRVMLLVLKEGKTIDDAKSGVLTDSVDYLDQTTATETGSFVFTFPSHSGDEFARLTAVINEKNQLNAVDNIEIVYYTDATAGVMTESIVDLTDENLVKSMLTADAIALLQLDDTYYSLLGDNQLEVCKVIADLTAATQAQLQTAFAESSFVTYVNAMTTAEDVETLFGLLEEEEAIKEKLGFTREDDLYKGLNNVDELKTRILSGIPYSSAADLKAKVTESFALTAIHNYRYTYMENILNTYNSVLKLDLTKITSKNESKIYEGIAGQEYEDANDLKSDFNSLATTSSGVRPSGSSSGGGGGGSFSGAGFGGMTSAAQAPTAQEKEEQQTQEDGFTDLADDHYAAKAVEALVEKGIISGYPDGSFKPENDVIRTEMIKMLVTAFGIEKAEGETAAFEDLTENDWYYDYCVAAITNGILNGVSETSIGADMPVTRQDVCVLLHRAITKLGYTLEAKNEVAFGDETEIADYAKESVMLFAGAGIVNGDGENFNPTDVASRGACAKIIYNVLAEVLQ